MARPPGVFSFVLRGQVRAGAALVAALLAFGACSLLAPEPAAAQVSSLLHFPPRQTQPKAPTQPSDSPMLVQADEMKYDYTNDTVSALGNVQIYYRGSSIEADEVTYDQKTKRLRAKGNARLTEPNGRITYGQYIDLTDEYRDGFVDSLRLETIDDTRMAASRADRDKGTYTVMQNGVYTACEPCKDDPKKPPLWQVQAARIVHDDNEKMLYFEDARIEFFGMPLMYMPFTSMPDPSVKRKSGFLFPLITETTQYGLGVQLSYFWALAPDYDLTFSTTVTTKEGELFQAAWRQRLADGTYTVKMAGIFQQDPGYFAQRDGAGSPTADLFRGAIQTAGQFSLTNQWVWGWTGLLVTDTQFLYDYELTQFTSSFDPFRTGIAAEGISQLYLTGASQSSYFDIRSIYYYGFSGADVQAQIPIIHPVLDYTSVLPQPVVGGEFSYKFNLTSLTRQQAEFDAVTQNAANQMLCASGNSAVLTPANCLLRGIAGTYTRASAEVDWRRTFVTDNGQMITPFASLRGDLAQLDVSNQAGISNYIGPGSSEPARFMPAVGVEYRYPFVDVESWGTQTIEPIAQLILRPNETEIGKFPNEDAQSVVFSDANLFSIDKFSGWDRVEGGGRVNAGLQYTAQFNKAGSVNVMFGQSYQIYGLNSYAATDLINTGLESGLDKAVSDYVGRITYQPNQTFSFTARGRFSSGGYDPGTGQNVAAFTPERIEFEGRANFDRWTLQLLYGDYAPQPDIGFLTARQEILAGASVKLTQNWVLLGSIRYDLAVHQFDTTRVGVGYVDDCLLLALNYFTSYTYTGVTPTPNNTFMLQFSLRTLGPDVLPAIGSAAY
ncbi:MAG TPA: LPS-assembly protein LptD [Xanthobacteraceae bacterium]|nr:LPS-assembly protein LptD [Xanthobacteraceae bacterium]